MQYLEKTIEVKTALLGRPDLLEEIKAIFNSHMAEDENREPVGRGTSRFVYKVGNCKLTPEVNINLLLKLKKNQPGKFGNRMKFPDASKRWKFNEWPEFGAFEVYYDFIVGNISHVSFQSKSGYTSYSSSSILGKGIKETFSLAEKWGGTTVSKGDIGAIPYFQMVVRYKNLFGQLTEGLPSFIKPNHTAQCDGTSDDNTVEAGRIIDLGSTQSILIDADRGGHLNFNDEWKNNISVRSRGEKYFRPVNRLDL